VVEEHGIGWSQLGDLIQTPANEIACNFAITLLWEIWRLSVYNCLVLVSAIIFFGNLVTCETYAKLTEDVIVGLRWVWVTTEGALDDRQAQAPNVTLNTVGASSGVCPCLSDTS
jgi:hypothetical protein